MSTDKTTTLDDILTTPFVLAPSAVDEVSSTALVDSGQLLLKGV